MLDRTIIATENISNLTERILSFRNKHQTDPYLMMNLPTAMAVWDKQDWNVINRIKLIHMIDVLVDGQFQLENQDLYNEHIVWAGSTNQRVIDVPATLSDGKIHIHNSK